MPRTNPFTDGSADVLEFVAGMGIPTDSTEHFPYLTSRFRLVETKLDSDVAILVVIWSGGPEAE